MPDPQPSFSGKCPKCGSYHTRRCTEVINYSHDGEGDPPPVVSRTRIYHCNACKHGWC